MNPKVLVADDSGVMRKIIIRTLNEIGITDVVQAADGAEALEKFAEGGIELVLTDWNMPNKTGLEVLKEIRAGESSVPVIMITTEAEKGRIMEAIQAGVTDYLAKPFDAEALRQKLEKNVLV